MKNPREHYLSACFCACPLRRREAGRKPDTCEMCEMTIYYSFPLRGKAGLRQSRGRDTARTDAGDA
jgi:hypothetical protein